MQLLYVSAFFAFLAILIRLAAPAPIARPAAIWCLFMAALPVAVLAAYALLGGRV